MRAREGRFRGRQGRGGQRRVRAHRDDGGGGGCSRHQGGPQQRPRVHQGVHCGDNAVAVHGSLCRHRAAGPPRPALEDSAGHARPLLALHAQLQNWDSFVCTAVVPNWAEISDEGEAYTKRTSICTIGAVVQTSIPSTRIILYFWMGLHFARPREYSARRTDSTHHFGRKLIV